MKLKQYIVLILIAIVSCTEPYELQTENFEDLLVVEATITNEYKKHVVKLSHTIPLEETTPPIEHGANVKIISNTGLEFHFSEIEDQYVSDQEFQIEPGLDYTLQIQTSNGKTYISTPEKTPTAIGIDEVNALQETKDTVLGVAIKVTSSDPSNTAKFYRYEYTETYKIIPPYWSPNKVEVNANDELIVSPRTTETRVCFSSKESNSINVTTTEDQSENTVSNFNVHFLSKKDPKITNRYSILVKQYIISSEAYNFYKTLKTLSSNGSLLSQVQPGFIVGNITNTNNPEEKVVGFFEVSTVSEKRIFFNFDDIFPNETSSSYFYDCGIQDYTSLVDFPSPNSPLFGGRVDLFYFIRNNEIVYYDHHPTSGLYLMVYSYCGDCTSFSSNIQPDFWQ